MIRVLLAGHSILQFGQTTNRTALPSPARTLQLCDSALQMASIAAGQSVQHRGENATTEPPGRWTQPRANGQSALGAAFTLVKCNVRQAS
jgi:hypothetical protein